MKAGIWCGTLIATLLTVSAFAQKPPQSDTPTQSEKRSGPGGLEGWTLEGPLPDDPAQNYPFALVIARNGLVIRKIDGDPFVWKWMFLANGRQVAYESGPLHFR